MANECSGAATTGGCVAATVPISGLHGAGASTSMLVWERHPNGRDPANQSNAATIEIASQLIMGGVHDLQGASIMIQPTLQPAQINLAGTVRKHSFQ